MVSQTDLLALLQDGHDVCFYMQPFIGHRLLIQVYVRSPCHMLFKCGIESQMSIQVILLRNYSQEQN